MGPGARAQCYRSQYLWSQGPLSAEVPCSWWQRVLPKHPGSTILLLIEIYTTAVANTVWRASGGSA